MIFIDMDKKHPKAFISLSVSEARIILIRCIHVGCALFLKFAKNINGVVELEPNSKSELFFFETVSIFSI